MAFGKGMGSERVKVGYSSFQEECKAHMTLISVSIAPSRLKIDMINPHSSPLSRCTGLTFMGSP